MTPREQKILFAVGICFFIAAVFYTLNYSETTMFGQFSEQFTPVNWDEVASRNIVKNSIPVTIIDRQNGDCLVSAHYFDSITDHRFFVKGDDLGRKLQYDNGTETLVLPCDDLEGEKSRLNIWYATEEAKKHSMKYEYFITPWNETDSEK